LGRRSAGQAAPQLTLTEHQKREAIRRRDRRDGEPVREIARSYNVGIIDHSPRDRAPRDVGDAR
jgi:hypothetical protein